jgi:hypothetical protein
MNKAINCFFYAIVTQKSTSSILIVKKVVSARQFRTISAERELSTVALAPAPALTQSPLRHAHAENDW